MVDRRGSGAGGVDWHRATGVGLPGVHTRVEELERGLVFQLQLFLRTRPPQDVLSSPRAVYCVSLGEGARDKV